MNCKTTHKNQTIMTNKDYKFITLFFIAISLFGSMIYVAAIDSMDAFDMISYGALLGGMWYFVSKLYKKSEMNKDLVDNSPELDD